MPRCEFEPNWVQFVDDDGTEGLMAPIHPRGIYLTGWIPRGFEAVAALWLLERLVQSAHQKAAVERVRRSFGVQTRARRPDPDFGRDDLGRARPAGEAGIALLQEFDP